MELTYSLSTYPIRRLRRLSDSCSCLFDLCRRERLRITRSWVEDRRRQRHARAGPSVRRYAVTAHRPRGGGGQATRLGRERGRWWHVVCGAASTFSRSTSCPARCCRCTAPPTARASPGSPPPRRWRRGTARRSLRGGRVSAGAEAAEAEAEARARGASAAPAPGAGEHKHQRQRQTDTATPRPGAARAARYNQT